MDTKVILKAEAVLDEMLKNLKTERSSLYSDINLSSYQTTTTSASESTLMMS